MWGVRQLSIEHNRSSRNIVDWLKLTINTVRCQPKGLEAKHSRARPKVIGVVNIPLTLDLYLSHCCRFVPVDKQVLQHVRIVYNNKFLL